MTPTPATCAATKPLAFSDGVKSCSKTATHGEWCRMHAQSLGGWVLMPPAAQPAPALDVARLARAEHKRALSGGDERCHHSSRSGNDCERIARFLAREYAALAEPQS